MIITCLDKVKLVYSIYKNIYKMPNLKEAIIILLNPVDITRYIEFTYILKSIKKHNICINKVLDVSSPFILSYVLSAASYVIKTDINVDEKRHINESNNLIFNHEDATKMSYGDNTFDLVYSVSVIEHIYNNYMKSLNEMIRVLKPGGYLYVTFPVSEVHVEEWTSNNIYSNQFKSGEEVFFQYRFDALDVKEMLDALVGVTIVDCSIYWERKNGLYDKAMDLLRKKIKPSALNLLKKSAIDMWYGLTLLSGRPDSFSEARAFGNASVLVRKNIS